MIEKDMSIRRSISKILDFYRMELKDVMKGWITRTKEKIWFRYSRLIAYKYAESITGKIKVFTAGLIIQIPNKIRIKIPIIDITISRILHGVKMRGLGSVFYIDGLNNMKHIQDHYEKEIQDWFKITSDDVFIDVGANIGRYTIQLAKKANKVYSFEPCSKTYEYLKRNVAVNKLDNVEIFKIGLWENDEVKDLYVKQSNGINSIVEKDNAIATQQIKVVKLDTFIKKFEVARIDLIKIDVEGAEKEVLKGMVETIKQFSPNIIIESKNNNIKWIKKFLGTQGYRIFDQDKKRNIRESIFYSCTRKEYSIS